jgi:hypothetical protein
VWDGIARTAQTLIQWGDVAAMIVGEVYAIRTSSERSGPSTGTPPVGTPPSPERLTNEAAIFKKVGVLQECDEHRLENVNR